MAGRLLPCGLKPKLPKESFEALNPETLNPKPLNPNTLNPKPSRTGRGAILPRQALSEDVQVQEAQEAASEQWGGLLRLQLALQGLGV